MQDLSRDISVVRSTLIGAKGPVSHILVHPKGKSLATSVKGSENVELWNLAGTNTSQSTVKMQKTPIRHVIHLKSARNGSFWRFAGLFL